MSVLIKGMEMPTNCADCPLNYDQMACAVTWTRWWSDSMVIMNFDSDKERMPNCPLVETPTPHGRLGDLDALRVFFADWYRVLDDNMREEVALRYIDDAPTVIEAEE